MKFLLDISYNKAAFIMELLKNFSFVKAEALENMRNAVEEIKLIQKGTLKGIPAKDLLDEL